MKFSKALAGIVLAAGIHSASGIAWADKPADDFLNPQDEGGRLNLMAIIGPGFRANYDYRVQLEQDVTELRTQIIGDVVFPYAEVSANVDIRWFLLTLGGSVGYHNEWNLLQFNPNYEFDSMGNAIAGLNFGKDYANQDQYREPSGVLIGPQGFANLDREARRVKAQNTDVQSAAWPYYEVRAGAIWPAQNFLAVTTAAIRFNDRPPESFDWANATVMNGGYHLRWETYGFFRDDRYGFIGPALRILNVARNELSADATGIKMPANEGRYPPNPDGTPGDIIPAGTVIPNPPVKKGDACQMAPGIPCQEVRQWDFQYGFIGGIRTNWVNSSDVFLVRVYTAFGTDKKNLFGTHTFGLPIQLLFAYSVDVDF